MRRRGAGRRGARGQLPLPLLPLLLLLLLLCCSCCGGGGSGLAAGMAWNQAPCTRANPSCPNARRGAPFVLIPTTDLVFYALGCGEYDEMARECAAGGGRDRRAHICAWAGGMLTRSQCQDGL